MSFQLFVQMFENGSPAGFDREILRRAFPVALDEIEDDYWQADFGDAGRCDLFLGFVDEQPNLIHRVSIDHPVADDRLWTVVWNLLAPVGTVFHFPGADAALTRDPNIATALPAELLNALGPPLLIADFMAIAESLKNE